MGLNWGICYLFDMLCVQQGLAAKSLYVCENHSQFVNLLHKTCSFAQQMKRKYIGTAYFYERKSVDQSLLAAEYFDRSIFLLKYPGIFRRLAIFTFHAFVTLLAFRVRLFMGLEFRVWSPLLANGAMDLEHREYSIPSLSLIFPLFFIFDFSD